MMKWLKPILPRSLFGRVLLIVVMPTVLIQLVLAYVFFERHWDNVTRSISNTLAGEIGFFVQRLKKAGPEDVGDVVSDFVLTSGIAVSLEEEGAELGRNSGDYPEFQQRMKVVVTEPFSVRRMLSRGVIEVRVAMDGQLLKCEIPVKRLESRTTVIFAAWMLGATVMFLLIAVLFLRNQIRPIRRLAEAADNFGRGVDTPGFRPHGALEVRKAARAFIIMRERIKRQLRTRTEMLAGISHDLRTPLTRMKLELAMLPEDERLRESVQELQDDVQQMEHMIEEYLSFARGEGREDAVRLSLRELLEDLVADYQRLRASVQLEGGEDVVADVRVTALRRVMHNVIDNALRYGKHCKVSLRRSDKWCEITIDDDGPGIPADKREEVFKPFSRLDPSRNAKTGGVGLGLSIARDIVLAHGGRIALDVSPQGGLRVVVTLPL